MKYILIDDCGNDIFTKEYSNMSEALKAGEMIYRSFSKSEIKRRFFFYLLKSADPEETAENHLDGDIVKTWI